MENDILEDANMDFEEFSKFCDFEFAAHDNVEIIQNIVAAFVQVVERRQAARVAMWQSRALFVDWCARFTIPLGYLSFLGWLYSLKAQCESTMEYSLKGTCHDFENLKENDSMQILFILSGMAPTCLVIVICVACA